MKFYRVMFKEAIIGLLEVHTDNLYFYKANKEVISELTNDFPIFDILKSDISNKEISFFKVRLERMSQENLKKFGFETDNYVIEEIE